MERAEAINADITAIGPVVHDRSDPRWLGADKQTNNTEHATHTEQNHNARYLPPKTQRKNTTLYSYAETQHENTTLNIYRTFPELEFWSSTPDST